ncbi:MAG: hypothetical protein QM765_07470 [Myxococcales bacterium]
MRLLVLAILGGALAALSNCGTPTSACEQVAQKKDAVVDGYCQGKDDVCWFCQCLNRDQAVKVTVSGQDVTFSCVPAKDETSAACEGTALEEARACLADASGCIDDAATLDATSKCGATKP